MIALLLKASSVRIKTEGVQKRLIIRTVHNYDKISRPHLDFFKPSSGNLLS